MNAEETQTLDHTRKMQLVLVEHERIVPGVEAFVFYREFAMDGIVRFA
jgi:hypothetical protein